MTIKIKIKNVQGNILILKFSKKHSKQTIQGKLNMTQTKKMNTPRPTSF